jgi:predicted metal-binding membrane protein
MDRSSAHQSSDGRHAFYAAVLASAAFAWLALWLGEASPYGRYLDHESALDGAAGTALPALALFVTGWTLMVIATLVPTATPLMSDFGRVVRKREHPRRLQAQLVAGFVGVWALFGYGAFVADSLVHGAVAGLPWLAERPQLIAAGVLAAAGAFQFSSLKQRCLRGCRSPASLLFRHWGGSAPPGQQAARVGAAYGISCVGCCWALMLLMFAFAMGSLAWMAALAAVMAVEKHARYGVRLTRPLGVVLLASAAAVLAFGG